MNIDADARVKVIMIFRQVCRYFTNPLFFTIISQH